MVKSEGLKFRVSVIRQDEPDTSSVQYDVNIEKVEGKLKVFGDTEKLHFFVSFVDKPDMKLNIKPVHGSPDLLTLEEDVIVDTITNAIVTATVDFQFVDQTDFPKFEHKKEEKDSDMLVDLNLSPSKQPSTRHEQRLLVKVVKATNLGGTKDCQEPYCVIEMDEPSQRFQTSFGKDGSNPFWDENFLFNVKNKCAEILFEIYDRGTDGKEDQFLGLAIVGVGELLCNTSQRQVIPLQSQPIQDDSVTGSLTVEFLFMEGAEVPIIGDASGKLAGLIETNSRVTPTGTVITTTTFKKTEGLELEVLDMKADSLSDVSSSKSVASQGSVETLTDAALRELENREKTESPSSPEKSTLIIHGVYREGVHPGVKVKLDKNGRWREVSQSEGTVDSSTTSPSSPLSKSEHTATGESVSSSASEKEEVFFTSSERGRMRDRRSFMGTLRKRLSLRNNRSKSVDQKAEAGESISRDSSRSFSSDRSRSVPRSQMISTDRTSGVPGIDHEEDSSARSSISDGSGVSSSSTRTYIHEKSTLVVETNENGVIKHYLLPSSLANHTKWRKIGVKLHIYNDHIFVAKHLPGSTVCQICGRNLSRHLGKQGYECRDCNLVCHKSCHVRVDSYCPHSTINTMDMEYVRDRRAKSKSS
ncbi:phospholipid transfer protein C2CD2L-like isoform X2 [Tachypleus tridentatus]|uniref:phospholipid transfer protein C2CD2L-like isoform X2 n=1 Tax=Tachypleus tridentatus TaxID=6853 RepID=UPI003FD1D974